MHDPAELFDVEAVRRLEAAALHASGDPSLLMERAGQAAWRCVLGHWPQAQRFVVVCGPGGNGGDGYVLARHLHAAGRDVRVISAAGANASKNVAAAMARDSYLQAGGRETTDVAAAGDPQDLVVDALFGIGFRAPVDATQTALISWMNTQPAPVLALDTPSGLDGNGAVTVGVAVRASRTLEFLLPKASLRTGAALDYAGALELATLDVESGSHAGVTAFARMASPADLDGWLRPRRHDTHKGDFGRVLCIGGETGSAGAIALCAEAALRCGAGLVRVHTPASHVPGLLARLPEVMVSTIDNAIDWAWPTVLAIGPGLGTGSRAAALLRQASGRDIPQVWDADALTLSCACRLSGADAEVAGNAEQSAVVAGADQSMPRTRNRVLTPHPGEAARLLDCTVEEVQRDRFAALAELVRRKCCTVVLKGAGTLVGAPGQLPVVVGAGNPGMATGGMGDVLTGVIAALLAQGLAPFEAACCGATLHGAAGDAAAREGARGMLASDLMAPLRRKANPTCN